MNVCNTPAIFTVISGVGAPDVNRRQGRQSGNVGRVANTLNDALVDLSGIGVEVGLTKEKDAVTYFVIIQCRGALITGCLRFILRKTSPRGFPPVYDIKRGKGSPDLRNARQRVMIEN